MKKIIRLFAVLTSLAMMSAHAASPASKEYVDNQVLNLQTQINHMTTYTAGSGISISNGVITATDTTPTYTLYQLAQGGVVYYLAKGNAHGLAAALVNQSNSSPWAPNNSTTGAELIGIYLGNQNTTRIIQVYGSGSSYAALLCNQYTGGGYTDWYLPSVDELSLMFMGSISNTNLPQDQANYWSSTEYSANNNQSLYVRFTDGDQNHQNSTSSNSVRCIRSF